MQRTYQSNILTFFSVILFFSCGERKEAFERWRLKEASLSYEEELRIIDFPKETIEHFPDSIQLLPVKLYKNLDSKSSCQSILLFEYFVSEHALNVVQNPLAKYLASNDSLLVIENHRIGTFTKRYKSYQDFEMNLGYYPIPFFEKEEYNHPEDAVSTKDIYSDSTVSGLSEDFIIYILNSKPGIYLGNLKPLEYMPNGWENGYSKGVCINKKRKIVIYWTLIW